MYRIILPILALIFVGCANTTTAKDEQTVTEEDLVALRYLKEVEWPKAYSEQDTVLLGRILGEDFQMIDAAGNWSDKAGELKWITENTYAPDSFFYDIKRLDALENGTVLICGQGNIYSDSVHTIYQSSNILIKRDGIWKAVASHVSGIKTVN